LDWWERKLPFKLRKKLSAMWIYFLMVTLVSWLIVMELGIFGYFPGVSNSDTILNIVGDFGLTMPAFSVETVPL
jgi:ABC-type dipeptide/oligopeptide/nickel transport system permease component